MVADVVRKVEGLHMMVVVCSFLFPLGLQGRAFAASPRAAFLILLGTAYALLLKGSLTDIDQSLYQLGALYRVDDDDRGGEARRGAPSRLRADLYLLGLPYALLGIAVTGVGFLAALGEAFTTPCPPRIATMLLACGPALTWLSVALADALLRDTPPPSAAAQGRTPPPDAASAGPTEPHDL